jgi:hypothetical protein
VLQDDESRYQLRLMRPQGTIKSDLFQGYAAAVAAAEEWRQVTVPINNRSMG